MRLLTGCANCSPSGDSQRDSFGNVVELCSQTRRPNVGAEFHRRRQLDQGDVVLLRPDAVFRMKNDSLRRFGISVLEER